MPRAPDVSNLIAWLCAMWLVAILVLLGLYFWGTLVRLHWTTTVYLGATVVLSAVAFAAMGLDKFKAKHNARRIPESVLHTFELLGGWPGSMLGQRTFHHKTSKIIYQVVFYVITLIHLFLIAWLIYVWWTKAEPASAAPAAEEVAMEVDMGDGRSHIHQNELRCLLWGSIITRRVMTTIDIDEIGCCLLPVEEAA